MREMFIQLNVQENEEASVEMLISSFLSDHTEGFAKAITEIKKIADLEKRKELWERLCQDKEFKKYWENLKVIMPLDGRIEIENIFETAKELELS